MPPPVAWCITVAWCSAGTSASALCRTYVSAAESLPKVVLMAAAARVRALMPCSATSVRKFWKGVWRREIGSSECARTQKVESRAAATQCLPSLAPGAGMCVPHARMTKRIRFRAMGPVEGEARVRRPFRGRPCRTPSTSSLTPAQAEAILGAEDPPPPPPVLNSVP